VRHDLLEGEPGSKVISIKELAYSGLCGIALKLYTKSLNGSKPAAKQMGHFWVFGVWWFGAWLVDVFEIYLAGSLVSWLLPFFVVVRFWSLFLLYFVGFIPPSARK